MKKVCVIYKTLEANKLAKLLPYKSYIVDTVKSRLAFGNPINIASSFFKVILKSSLLMKNNLFRFHLIIDFISINSLDPSIVISYADNTSLFSFLEIIKVKYRVIAIQNGQRVSFKRSYLSHFINKSPIKYDIYFAFGNYIRRIFNEKNVQYNNIFVVGSFREIISRECRIESNEIIMDNNNPELIYISNWRRKLVNDVNHQELFKSLKYLFEFISHKASKEGIKLSIKVLLGNHIQHSHLEVDHYLNLFKNIEFIYNGNKFKKHPVIGDVACSKSYDLIRKKKQCLLGWVSTLTSELNSRDFNAWSIQTSDNTDYHNFNKERRINMDTLKKNPNHQFFDFLYGREKPSYNYDFCTKGSIENIQSIINNYILQ